MDRGRPIKRFLAPIALLFAGLVLASQFLGKERAVETEVTVALEEPGTRAQGVRIAKVRLDVFDDKSPNPVAYFEGAGGRVSWPLKTAAGTYRLRTWTARRLVQDLHC